MNWHKKRDLCDMMSNNSSNIEPLHPEAFEKLFKMVHKPLLRFICRMCGNLKQAEDVVQDVFVRIWERKSELDLIFVKPSPHDCGLLKRSN